MFNPGEKISSEHGAALSRKYFKILALRKERSVHNNSFSQIKTVEYTICAGREIKFQSGTDTITGRQYLAVDSKGARTIYFSRTRYDELDWKVDPETGLENFRLGSGNKYDPANVREVVLECRTDWVTGRDKWREQEA